MSTVKALKDDVRNLPSPTEHFENHLVVVCVVAMDSAAILRQVRPTASTLADMAIACISRITELCKRVSLLSCVLQPLYA